MRGQIYQLKASRTAKGHEQKGNRYAVVVQTSRLVHVSTWVVVPTSTSPHISPGALHPVLDWGQGETRVLCEAIKSVDPQASLGQLVAFAPLSVMQDIDRALRFLLDLP